MTIRADEKPAAPNLTVPVQAGTVPVRAGTVPDRVPTVVDHIHTHGKRCYWDFRDADWVCTRD
jgi:hypothetical protein